MVQSDDAGAASAPDRQSAGGLRFAQ
ncbi:hypothetical protein FHS29_004436 [Saccharothrix tamanrassetensis]|uniref:Uncharacterized protein n=1 Tax=Saccharothrix tamanrassetensis TaxID=1051531 RepID=A0A841CK16_9PSEU|nr:hypothetical protein [Saccharothrix tamanrassetensis]